MSRHTESDVRSDPFLSTTEVGELFDVHASTVKRWCDGRDLEFSRTEGGHRRIPLSAALRLARETDEDLPLLAFDRHAAAVWRARAAAREGDWTETRGLAVQLLSADELPRMSDILVHLGRDPGIDLSDLLDEGVRPLMEQVGDRWSRGEIGPGVEHMVSEAMLGVLHRLRQPGPGGSTKKSMEKATTRVALVGAMEGERHDLGARCVRVALERAGWEVRFLGADVPLEEWGDLQRAYGARLVCVSFSRLRGDADLLRCARRLAGSYEGEQPFVLALGGGASVDGPPDGSWPFTAVRFFPALGPFVGWLGETPGRG